MFFLFFFLFLFFFFFIKAKASVCVLHLFEGLNIFFFNLRAPNRRSLFQRWSNKGLV